MKITSDYLDTLIEIHITAGININHIVMHISQLENFFPDSPDEKLVKTFKPIKDKNQMIATGVFGSWRGIELKYSMDIDKEMVYAVSDESQY
jgi:hypothetical protein